MNRVRKRRGCLLFYVYAYFLGLGSGIIATITLSEKDPPVATWVLLPLGILVSVTTCVVHLILTCHSPAGRSYKRSVLDLVGLSLASLLTYSGTFFFLSDKSLFFLCGVFSASCYLMATIAVSVNLYQKCKRNNAQSETGAQEVESHRRPDDNNSNRDFIRELELLSSSAQGAFFIPMYLGNASLPDRATSTTEPTALSVITTGQLSRTNYNSALREGQGRHDLTVAQLALLAVPPNVSLPSYEEVTALTPNSPPKYSELPEVSEDVSISAAQSDGTVAESLETSVDNFSVETVREDNPPDYYESASHDL